MTPDLAAALTRSLFCGAWPKEGRVSVYVSFSDESSTSSQQDGKFFIGGLIAKETDWPEFSYKWVHEVLQSEPRIPYLHMIDIRSPEWRLKNNICRLDGDSKVRRATQVISSAPHIYHFIAQVSESCFIKAKRRLEDKGVRSKRHHNEVDYVCFIAYALSALKFLWTEQVNVQRLSFNISRKKHISHYIEHSLQPEMFAGLSESNNPLGKILGDINALEMKDHMPLQAADVLCWHLQRSNKDEEADQEVLHNIQLLQNQELITTDISDKLIEKITDNLINAMAKENE